MKSIKKGANRNQWNRIKLYKRQIDDIINKSQK